MRKALEPLPGVTEVTEVDVSGQTVVCKIDPEKYDAAEVIEALKAVKFTATEMK
ncbi:MAG: hypothetical protein N2C14_01890 [Planctomycetales bacterium]